MADDLYTIKYLLEKNRNTFVSGETLAEELGVSRAAVWKQIERLREAGFNVASRPRLGYRLDTARDKLFAAGIDYWLDRYDGFTKPPLTVLERCESTNITAKERLADHTGGDFPTFVIAEEQIAGRGRRGRNFYSPPTAGIYLSMAFRPDLRMEQGQRVTCAAAVQIMRALTDVTGREPAIKWVNDLYYNERKISGILTEAVTDFENGKVTGIVVGVGVNVFFDRDKAPAALRDIAGGLFTADERADASSRNRIAAAMIYRLASLAADHGEARFRDDILPAYRANMFLIGREITIEKPDGSIPATVRDIDAEGRLVCSVDGETVALSSGEISLRF